MARRREPRIPDAIVDQLLAGAYAKTIFDPNGLMNELNKAAAGSQRRDGSPFPWPATAVTATARRG